MKSFAPALFAAVLGLASFGCAAPLDSDGEEGNVAGAQTTTKTIQASNDAAHSLLASTVAVHSAAAPQDLTVRVYEVAEGDPSRNGMALKLALDGGSRLQGIWDLGTDVRSVTSISAPQAGRVVIKGMRGELVETGAYETAPFQTVVTYRVTGAGVDSRLTVQTMFSTKTVVQETDAASRFLGSVHKITAVEDGEINARLFQIGGGDPAMNGDHLVLSLMNAEDARTYELGLDVAAVETFTLARAGELRIRGLEDEMTPGGEMSQKRFTYAVQFSVDDAAPSSTISLAAK
jgi:hypothetical protein